MGLELGLKINCEVKKNGDDLYDFSVPVKGDKEILTFLPNTASGTGSIPKSPKNKI